MTAVIQDYLEQSFGHFEFPPKLEGRIISCPKCNGSGISPVSYFLEDPISCRWCDGLGEVFEVAE